MTAIYLEMRQEQETGEAIVEWLLAKDVTMWRIHKEVGVTYLNVKAWARGWWKPDYVNTGKLRNLKYKVEKERRI